MIYLDSCALVKLATFEAESAALHAWLTARSTVPRVSSVLIEIEAHRALHRTDPNALAQLPALLAAVVRLEITPQVRRTAAAYAMQDLRTLDAIHLATAEPLVDELVAFVTYDRRLADAATSLGLPVVAPPV